MFALKDCKLPILSICVPTFNRAENLRLLLGSLCEAKDALCYFNICISDNSSDEATWEVVKGFVHRIKILYHKNSGNIGMARNILQAVSLATAEYAWVIGDDDIVLADKLLDLIKILNQNRGVKYFFVNSICCKHVVDIVGLPSEVVIHKLGSDNLFSKIQYEGLIGFDKIISPTYSFDFLGGIYLSVFSVEAWAKSVSCIDYKSISTVSTFSTLDNTFPHVKIFAHAFMGSMAYYSSVPYTVNTSDARDWASLYPIVRIFRMNDCLNEYRKNGLSWCRFIICRNSTYKNFMCDYISIRRRYPDSAGTSIGVAFFISKIIYPYAFLSIFRCIFNRLKMRFRLKSSLNGDLEIKNKSEE
jgi:glycosyltransferase involved in cell wall biosynthesis